MGTVGAWGGYGWKYAELAWPLKILGPDRAGAGGCFCQRGGRDWFILNLGCLGSMHWSSECEGGNLRMNCE